MPPTPEIPNHRSPAKPRASASGARSRAHSDQIRAAALGVALLVAAFLLQHYILQPRKNGKDGLVKDESDKSLRSLAIAFPRLTLGGFRGLLATYLWIQAENDKNDRKWVELETKYDIIGSLQPYFISVYIYHAWNQAYNLSAQWHDEDTKYKWVLDGLAYLYKGEEYNPNTPDLLVEQGHMYFMKLGGSFERIFYRAHWRSDISRFHELNGPVKPDKYDTLQLVHDFVMRVSPENREAASKTTNPVELQKLNLFHTAELVDPSGRTTIRGYGVSVLAPELFGDKPMEFRYGLSPFYFAYVEYNRMLATGWPSTAAPRIADSWPAMSLRMWCRDDMFYSQQSVKELFGPDGLLDPQNPPRPEQLDDIANKEADIKDCYRNISLVAPVALDQFGKHLARYPENKYIHQKHIKETKSYLAMSKAESALFTALLAWQNDGRKLDGVNNARALFTAALPLYDDSINIAEVWVDELYPIREGQAISPDRIDSEKYVNALRTRKAGIENILKLGPTETANLSFLNEETVER